MSDVSDEIDSLVSRGEPPAPRTKRRPRKEEVEEEEGDGLGILLAAGAERVEKLPSPEKSMSTQEQDLRELLPKELPQPVEKVKTLDEMASKYRVGQDTQFKLQVYRLTPKFFPGGIKADGYYDEWTVPLSEDIIASEYGGGQYRIRVMGPSPENPTGWKSYDSVVVDIGGEPKYGRRPRASQTPTEPTPAAPVAPTPGPYQMMGSSEDPKLSVEALKMSREMAQAEREERRRIEDRLREDAKTATGQINPLIEAHKQRADEVAQIVREKSEIERRVLEDRLSDERVQRQRLEEKVALMEQSRPSVAEEMGKLMQLMPRGDEGGSAAQKMLEQVLDKHRGELEAVSASFRAQLETVQKQSSSVMEQLRDSHRQEQAALRESHARQMEAERESWRTREERAETVLAAEREERRRDREMFQRNEESRDRQWKDRLENQELNLKAQWESRLSSTESALKMRIEWLQSEVDKKESEISDLRGRLQENSDPQAQFEKMASFREAAKNAFGMSDAPAPTPPGSGMGGIGMGNPLETFAEAAGERAPEIINSLTGLADRLMGGSKGSQSQQKPSYQPGQVVQTPQGPMMVVVDANQPGGLGLKSLQAVQAEEEAARRGGGPSQLGDGRRRLVNDMEDMVEARRASKRRGIIPNYAADLPRPNQPGEPVHPPMPDQRRTSRAVRQAPAQAAQPAQAPTQTQPLPTQPTPSESRLAGTEKQVAKMVASAINDAVMRGDDPEDFVAQAIQQVPPPVIAAICQKSTEEIVGAIREVAPQSAGATPAGEKFTRQAIRLLRQHAGVG